MDIALHCSWSFSKDSRGEYFVPYTHWIYIDFIARHFQKVYIISPVKNVEQVQDQNSISCFKNVEMISIPNYRGMLDGQKYFYQYYKAIKSIANQVDLFYCRVPGPFSWMPKLLFRKKCIMHYVGDSIDAALVNEKWNFVKKYLIILGYLPDYILTLLASKDSSVYTNGHQISEKLYRYKIDAVPVISSTILDSEIIKLNELSNHNVKTDGINIVFTGYLRYWKGIGTLFEIINLLNKSGMKFYFHVIGDGEMRSDFEKFIDENKLEDKVKLYGHINDRKKLMSLYRQFDIYVFPSLGGEGSPRSVIEAMAQGLPVISTPVGSLPTTFSDCHDIRFADFNNAQKFFDIILKYINSPESFNDQRINAIEKIRKLYTRDVFLKKVFAID